MIELYDIKENDTLIVFDYASDVINKPVLIILNDRISNTIVYKTSNGEQLVFSGQGFFEKLK